MLLFQAWIVELVVHMVWLQAYINYNLRMLWVSRLEDGAGRNHQEFQRWHNGGGTFHKSACIDPTAVVEIGAMVHSKSVVGAHVHIGSGAVIGPSVSIGQSTKIGYNTIASQIVIDLYYSSHWCLLLLFFFTFVFMQLIKSPRIYQIILFLSQMKTTIGMDMLSLLWNILFTTLKIRCIDLLLHYYLIFFHEIDFLF